MTAATSTGLAAIGDRSAVEVDGDAVDVADLVLLGTLTGEWLEFDREVSRGLELDRSHAEDVSGEELRREATIFRYERSLISAADLRSWLHEREMTVGELSAVLRRRLLRREHPHSQPPPSGPDGRAAVIRPEAYCDGVLGRLAQAAVARLAAARLAGSESTPDAADLEQLPQMAAIVLDLPGTGLDSLGPVELGRRLQRLLSLESALSRLREQISSGQAVARRINDHALDWLELRGEELAFGHEGAAREARLLLAVDGESPVEVAARAGVTVIDRRFLVGDAPAGAKVSFAAAAVGEVLGPWEQDGRWRVMRLGAKVPPSAQDESLRERAIDELLKDAIDRYAAGRTTQHAAL
jgi:hypothetical protein